MPGWDTFFAAQLGASAALAGLVLVESRHDHALGEAAEPAA